MPVELGCSVTRSKSESNNGPVFWQSQVDRPAKEYGLLCAEVDSNAKVEYKSIRGGEHRVCRNLLREFTKICVLTFTS